MPHAADAPPIDWIRRWAHLVPVDGPVLDLACGDGRHARFFAARGHPVLAVDRDADALAALAGQSGVETLCADLEGPAWPLGGRTFAAVVVTNYLWRPRLPDVVDAVAAAGVLLYQTFARGNEAFGKPRNPEFLLRPGELLGAVLPALEVVAYEHGLCRTGSCPRVVQRVVAVRGAAAAATLRG